MIVQGEKGLMLFNFYMMTQGTTAFPSSFSVPIIDAGNSRLVWLRGIHGIYLFSLCFVLIWIHTNDWFKSIFISFLTLIELWCYLPASAASVCCNPLSEPGRIL